ncbi:hypothetical protein [Azospirillum himalayense]|uniref:Uncharacterized protein n=1 Tax=Azospirillum himalayense TaxID=654847 RepID=A0ABW0GDC9_9PROT
MSSKINAWCIVQDHLDTLSNEQSNEKSLLDILVFYVAPLVAALLFYFMYGAIEKDAIAAAISALSIFAGLLINVLVLLYSISLRPPESLNKDSVERLELEKRFLRQIFANISYAILNAVLATVLLVISGMVAGVIAKVISSISVAFCINFVLTLIMSLKRIHMLLRRKF